VKVLVVCEVGAFWREGSKGEVAIINLTMVVLKVSEERRVRVRVRAKK